MNTSLANQSLDIANGDVSKHIPALNQGIIKNMQLNFHSGGCSVMKSLPEFITDEDVKKIWNEFVINQEKSISSSFNKAMNMDEYCSYVESELNKNVTFLKYYPEQYRQVVLFLRDFRLNIKNDGRCSKIYELENFLKIKNVDFSGFKDSIMNYHKDKELEDMNFFDMCRENE